MDRFCDIIVEEILRCLPAKYLHRIRAVSRRYNDIVCSPGFAERYWQSHSPHLSGIFLQTELLIRPWGDSPGFLAGYPRPSARESIFASDLGLLPPNSPESRLRPETMGDARKIFIVHSTAGLVLCARGRNNVVQYYLCNPVSWQCVSLPKLLWRCYYLYGLLSVTDNGDGIIRCFQVFLFNHPMMWHETGGCMDLKVFSSDTGKWREIRICYPPVMDSCLPPFLGQNGTIYWTAGHAKGTVIAYNCKCNLIQILPLPRLVADSVQNPCIGERQGGGMRYAYFDFSVFDVWDLQMEGASMWWKLVHRVSVMELAQQNVEAATHVTNKFAGSTIETCINSNSLFLLLGFHPTEDIIFMDVADTVASYSLVHGTIRYLCHRRCFRQDIFPYVHPAHPVQIPRIKLAPLKYKLF